MTDEDRWAVGAVRFARRTTRLPEGVAFFRDLVGLPLLLEFEAVGQVGGGAVFGLPGADVVLELVEAAGPVAVDPHEQLVLYLPGRQARDQAVRRLLEAGHVPVEQNRYWDDNDALTFRDPDGREVVFAPWVFGRDAPPARARARRS